jgi:NDP-sugar pyrophosphorylase family protein
MVRLLPVAILAGGLATRLRPLTENVPKALIDVNGEPFLAHQLRLLARAGVSQAVLCVGHRGEMVRDYVGDGRRFGIEVQFSFDGDRLLGTAGALVRAFPLLGDEFFVLYGDSYLPCDYVAIQHAFQASDRAGLMVVYRNADRWDRSNVEFANGQILAYDKRTRTPRMQYIDYGLGVLTQRAFDEVPRGQAYDLADVYRELLRRGQLAACEVPERFYEIGSPSGLAELREHLAGESQRVART